MSRELIEKAIQIVEDHPVSKSGTSKFALSNFVIGKEVTMQGKQWQCIREIEARLASIKSMKLQIDDLEDNLELIDIKTTRAEINYNRLLSHTSKELGVDECLMLEKELNINKRKYNREKQSVLASKAELEALLVSTQDELEFLVQAFEHLLKRGEWQDFNDSRAQTEFWNTKLAYEIGMRLSLGKPIDIELGRTIDALPKNFPIKEYFLNLIKTNKNITDKETDGKE